RIAQPKGAPNGERIARLRREKGWSQAALATHARCHKRTIERLESGAGVFLHTIYTVATALGIDPHGLLAGTVDGPGGDDAWQQAPFIAGPPLAHPRHFFGRERELQRLFNLWKHLPLQNAVLSGPAQSGKTSLLSYLHCITTTPPAQLRPGQRVDWLPHPGHYRWIMVDFQDPRLGSREGLLRYLLTQMEVSAPTPCDLERFLDVVADQLRSPTILLLDKIDVALQRYAELDNAFWEALRALATNQVEGNLAFVLAARERPEHLAHRGGLSSPFFNIFGYTAFLGPLTEPEARALVASSPLPFPPADVDWILTHS